MTVDVGTEHITLEIYRLTDGFPRSEMFSLSSQIRRAAASIATNLAEGCGRTRPEHAAVLERVPDG